LQAVTKESISYPMASPWLQLTICQPRCHSERSEAIKSFNVGW